MIGKDLSHRGIEGADTIQPTPKSFRRLFLERSLLGVAW